MTEWIYFLHPPRDDFAATMTEEERVAFAEHAEWLARLLADGVLIVAGPTGGPINHDPGRTKERPSASNPISDTKAASTAKTCTAA